jgi:riboflavin biosynthesis pyrimidine reductase
MIIKPRLCEFSDPMIPMAEMNDFYSINNLDIEDSTVPYTWSNSVISLDGIMHFKGKSQISDISLSSLTETAMADYRLLHFGWSLADAVLFSGQILRDEPQTSCQIKFDDIISFRRSMGKQSDHPLQLIISKECDFPHDHSIFSSALQIILITSQKGWDNIQHNLNQKTKATVNPLIIQENEPMRDILQRLKIEHNINVIQLN